MKTLTLFEAQLEIQIPDDCTAMLESMAALLYPYKKRPEILMTSRDDMYLFSASLLKKTLLDGQVTLATKSIREMFWALHPASQLTDISSTPLRNLVGNEFSFQTMSVDGPRLHVLYVISLDSRMMLMTTTCPLHDHEGKELMRQVALSCLALRKEDGK